MCRTFSIRFMSWTTICIRTIYITALCDITRAEHFPTSSCSCSSGGTTDGALAIVIYNYCGLASAHYPVMASTQSPVGWLILCFCSSNTLSGCTYPPLSCSKLRSTGLHSALDQSCHCPGRWGCAVKRRASWGSTWSVGPRDEWNLVRAD